VKDFRPQRFSQVLANRVYSISARYLSSTNSMKKARPQNQSMLNTLATHGAKEQAIVRILLFPGCKPSKKQNETSACFPKTSTLNWMRFNADSKCLKWPQICL